MKQTILVLGIVALLNSCGNSDKKETAPTGEQVKTEKKLSLEEERGETLIAQNDCLGCHKIEDRIIGPSYREVANKYENKPEVVDSLAQNIIKGHKGTWGQDYMTPHPTLSEADAKAMVTYILSLKQ